MTREQKKRFDNLQIEHWDEDAGTTRSEPLSISEEDERVIKAFLDSELTAQREEFVKLITEAGENNVSVLQILEDCDHGKTGTVWISQNNLLRILTPPQEGDAKK